MATVGNNSSAEQVSILQWFSFRSTIVLQVARANVAGIILLLTTPDYFTSKVATIVSAVLSHSF